MSAKWQKVVEFTVKAKGPKKLTTCVYCTERMAMFENFRLILFIRSTAIRSGQHARVTQSGVQTESDRMGGHPKFEQRFVGSPGFRVPVLGSTV